MRNNLVAECGWPPPDKLARGLQSRLPHHTWRERHLAAGFATAPSRTAPQDEAILPLDGGGLGGGDPAGGRVANSAPPRPSPIEGEGVDAANAIALQARIIGVSVQEMVRDGVEVIISVSCDPQLGPVLLFGSGGVMVEVYNDVALRRCPITRSEARAMIAEVKGPGCSKAFADDQRRTSRPSQIPWCACRTSPCTLKDTWQSWTSIHSWFCRQVRE